MTKLPIQSISEKVESNVAARFGGKKYKDTGRWRDLTAYWLLGLCNNYGYEPLLYSFH